MCFWEVSLETKTCSRLFLLASLCLLFFLAGLRWELADVTQANQSSAWKAFVQGLTAVGG